MKRTGERYLRERCPRAFVRCFLCALFSLLFSLLLSSCGRHKTSYILACREENKVAGILREGMKGWRVETTQTEELFRRLERGEAVEAWDFQAIPAIEQKKASYWYPLYETRLVLAVDRKQTGVELRGFRDIFLKKLPLQVIFDEEEYYVLLMTLGYALSDEEGTADFKEAETFLENMRVRGSLGNDRSGAILLLYDYQAREMVKEGRELEILVPEEGSLIFVSGILSRDPLQIPTSVKKDLNLAGFSLAGRQEEETYSREIFFKYTDIQWVKVSAYVLSMAAALIWTVYAKRRLNQSNAAGCVVATGVLLILWMLLKVLKMEHFFGQKVMRHMWYLYYGAQLSIPLVFLLLAWLADHGECRRPPLWWRWLALAGGLLLVGILSNDLHQQAFFYHAGIELWDDVYTYRWLFYLVYVWFLVLMAAGIYMLLQRGWRSSWRYMVIPPGTIALLLLTYNVFYTAGGPIRKRTEFVLVFTALIILFYESAMRSGLIPVNSRYQELFERSPLSMMITDGELNARWTAEGLGEEIGKTDLKRALEGAVSLNENRILRGKRIKGGAVFWQEDLSVLHDMERSLQMALQRQEKRNEILLREGQVRGEREALRARQQLMEEMEQRILKEIRRMEIMTDLLPRRGDDSRREEGRRIAVMIRTLACYVKRRLNLFFLGKAKRSDCG